jgi:protein-tyrosine phosphatase
MVTAAYLMLRDHCSRDEALAALRAQRPLVQPNPAFMKLLLEWEGVVKRPPP